MAFLTLAPRHMDATRVSVLSVSDPQSIVIARLRFPFWFILLLPTTNLGWLISGMAWRALRVTSDVSQEPRSAGYVATG